MRHMRLVLLTVATVAALALPGVARAGETPNPALAACVAEYQQLGPAGFMAKYGAAETAKSACVRAKGGAVVQPVDSEPLKPVQPLTNEAMRAVLGKLCARESSETGKRACMQAKVAQAQAIIVSCRSILSVKSAFEQCIKRTLGTTTGNKGESGERVAKKACEAEVRSLGYDAFQAKYGKGQAGLGACVRAKR
jgi:hypothetical protein